MAQSINFNTEILDYDGIPIPILEKEGSNKKVNMRLYHVCVNSLMTEKINEQRQAVTMSPIEKAARHHLAMKIFKKGEVSLTVDEISLLKECIHVAYTSPLVCTRACEILDPPVMNL